MIEFDVNESYPMVLSLWHEELRKDVIVRAAHQADRAAGFKPRSVADALSVLERPNLGARSGSLRRSLSTALGAVPTTLFWMALPVAFSTLVVVPIVPFASLQRSRSVPPAAML